MRTRLTALSALAGIALIASLVASPAQGAETEEFEGVVHVPNEQAFMHADVVCPDGGPGNGVTYVWIDLGEDTQFTKFILKAPHLAPIPDPGINGGANIGEHDLDLHLYDDKCKEITQHTNNLDSSVKGDTRRPARYALVNYYIGVHPNVEFTLEAST